MTSQLIVFALVDPKLPEVQRERIARKLHSIKREKVVGGKPKFPYVDLSGDHLELPDMSEFVSQSSWLLFDILQLSGKQDWLKISPSLSDQFEEFQKLKEFVLNLPVCNDVAERGVALISGFINSVESEGQREALLQVVEYHRNLVKDTNKSSLKLC